MDENERLVAYLKANGSIRRKDVERAFLDLPRHLFVPKDLQKEAYEDHPLPIGWGATISQPSIVASMTELLEPKKTDVILEVGTGSGWQAGIISRLVKQVYSIDIVPQLVEQAKENLKKTGIRNVEIKVGQGSNGWPEKAPFGGIIVTAAVPVIFETWVEQLKEGGRLLAPVGWPMQTMILGIKRGGKLEKKELYGCMFVPLQT